MELLDDKHKQTQKKNTVLFHSFVAMAQVARGLNPHVAEGDTFTMYDICLVLVNGLLFSVPAKGSW